MSASATIMEKSRPSSRTPLPPGVCEREREEVCVYLCANTTFIVFGFVSCVGKIIVMIVFLHTCRNGVLIDHYLTEVNGQNVIGLKDKQIAEVFSESPRTVTITMMPKFVYDHLMKK